MDLNLTSTFLCTKLIGRAMLDRGLGGRIINIASINAFVAGRRIAGRHYETAKAAVVQFTRATAVDWAPFGILVNAIGPGYIQTEMTRPLTEDPELDAWVKKRTPLARWGAPSDLAGAAVFLASDASAFVTGHVLYVDGGWLATF